jgi:hypothetical protein
MSRVYHLWSAVGLAMGLLATMWGLLAMQAAAQAASGLEIEQQTPLGGFVADGPSVNLSGASAGSPSLAVMNGSQEPWVAYALNNRVLVAQWDSSANGWVQQNGALNRSLANAAGNPSLDFAGAARDVAWVAWQEAGQINAASFNGANWAITPILNRNPANEARDPVLVAGATVSSAMPLPWVAWSESTGNAAQIAVSRAVPEQGGFGWEPVGAPFTFAPNRVAFSADLAFAGPGNTTPWIVWEEGDAATPERIFARRFVSDTWQAVGRQENCTTETTCALNLDPAQSASSPHITAGRVTTTTRPTPWIVFSEQTASGAAIRVLRLDIGTENDSADDRFIPVGGAVNSQCLGGSGLVGQGGAAPDIYFVGTVLHVAWIEQQNGGSNLYVCHLADVRPGQERWDLDTLFPINRRIDAPASAPSLSGNGSTSYVAWQEGSTPSNLYVAHRYPDGPAWGSNRPPFIRTISWSRDYVAVDAYMLDGINRAIQERITNEFTLTTSCNHAEGWEHIEEIQYKVANEELIVFMGKYVADDNLLFVADKDGEFTAPGFTPGTGQQIVTENVILNTAKTLIHRRGDDSPVVDIDWVMSFRSPTMNQDFSQQINIVYDNGQETGFFETGLLSFDYRAYLTTVSN